MGGLSCGDTFDLQANLILSSYSTMCDNGKLRTHILPKGDLVDQSGEKVGTVAGTHDKSPLDFVINHYFGVCRIEFGHVTALYFWNESAAYWNNRGSY